jgi:hypothetical protein
MGLHHIITTALNRYPKHPVFQPVNGRDFRNPTRLPTDQMPCFGRIGVDTRIQRPGINATRNPRKGQQGDSDHIPRLS